ncbi:MAG: hypothetical protein WC858_03135 [Parcubacteria group bacterium]|jgi:hypothetical protein
MISADDGWGGGQEKTAGAQPTQTAPDNLICAASKCGLSRRNCKEDPAVCRCKILNAGFLLVSGDIAVCDSCGAEYLGPGYSDNPHKLTCVPFGPSRSGGPETQGELP